MAAERSIDGPPMSICSMTSSGATCGLGRGLPERIEIHGDEVDGRDPVLGERLHVLRQVAAREQTAVHGGVQGLHPAVEHLGKVRQRLDVLHREAGRPQRARRAAGGDELPA